MQTSMPTTVPTLTRQPMADWHCNRCHRLLAKVGPNPGRIEVQCHSCHLLNVIDK